MAHAQTNGRKGRLTSRQVIDRIMEIVEAFPDVVKDLPERLKQREHWQKTFSGKNEPAARVMDVLRELPAFTNLSPKSPSKASWRKVFARHMGVGQIADLLRHADAEANFKPVKRKRVVYWRDAFGPGQVIQRVRPRESSDYIPNPHRGTTTFQRFQGDDTYPSFITADTYGPTEFPPVAKVRDNVKYIPRTTLSYCRWPWAWLEPAKGKFNWKLIDGTLKSARGCGQTAQIRFQPFTLRVDTEKNPPRAKRFPPKVSVNVPDWYWDTGATWIDDGPAAPKQPDHNDPLYLRHFGDFVRAFAGRYDGHPDLESIDVAYGGFWGEGGGNATAETAGKLVDIYLEGFRKTQLLSMLGTPGCMYAAKVAAQTGRAIGWRADCFGDLHLGNSPDVPAALSWNHTYDAYPKEIELCGVKDAWKTAPVTMETCGNVATWAMAGYDIDRIVEEGYKYHMSVFMPKNVFFPEKVLDKLVEFDRKIGYRFVLRQVLLHLKARPGAAITVDLFTDNVGCAPIYRPYRLSFRFKQGKKSQVVRLNEDIRTWLPGHNWFREEIVFPQGFERGEVKLAIGIVDETDTPRVWFAIDGKRDDGWHPLTSMEVAW